MSDDVEGGVDGGADTGTADQPWDLTGDAGAPGEPVEAEMVGAGWDDDGYDPDNPGNSSGTSMGGRSSSMGGRSSSMGNSSMH